jgi:predicted nucleotidyltransferase
VAAHGGVAPRLFGSFARGEEGPDSDVDILVEMPGRSLFDVVALKQDLEDLLDRRVDLVTPGALSPYLRDQILAEARSLE